MHVSLTSRTTSLLTLLALSIAFICSASASIAPKTKRSDCPMHQQGSGNTATCCAQDTPTTELPQADHQLSLALLAIQPPVTISLIAPAPLAATPPQQLPPGLSSPTPLRI